MVYLLLLLPIVLWLIILIVSFLLAEVTYSPAKRNVKARLLDSLRRISHAQEHIQDQRQCVLLFFSLVCSSSGLSGRV